MNRGFQRWAAGLAVALVSAAMAVAAPSGVDLTGVYMGMSRDEAPPNRRTTPWPNPAPYTAEGLKMARHWAEPANNLGLKCLPWWGPAYVAGGTTFFPLEVIQKDKQVTLINENMGMTRRVHTDGAALPDDVESSWMGYSVGRWEGDTLVVDTAHMRAGLANGSGVTVQGAEGEPRIPYSPATRLKERIRSVDGGQYLEVEVTLEDPVLYTRPMTIRRYLRRAPELQMYEYVCAENQRPEDEGKPPAR